MFNSTDSLPIALMQSLVLTVSDLKWTSDDTMEAMIGRGFGYMVLYATFENMGRWSYGIHLLSQVDDDTYPPHTARDAEQVNSAGVVPRQLPNTLSASPSSSSDEWGDSTLPYRRVVTPPTSSKWHSRMRRAKHALWTSLSKINKFMTVPMYAALSAFIVALIPPLQYVLKEEVPPVRGFLTSTGACTIPITLLTLGAYFHDEPPLKKLPSSGELSTSPTLTCDDRVADGPRIFQSHTESSDRSWLHSQEDEYLEGGHESLSQVGWGPAIATRSAGLWKNALGQRFGGIGRETLGRERQPGESTSVIVSCLARMVITPSILLPAMAALSSYNAHALFEDPVFVLSIILITSSPPALALVQMIQVASGEAFEILLRQTFFWAYCVLTPPLTLFYTNLDLSPSAQI
ncbi:uncharacterized protein EI90DRAFT_3151297 [Cantharellus anzutake]|uniref:uncharacterized protein n=1 Tax=Cantharellus anzutake TaxID=1750568 RepID=UPI001902EC8C|nr:uncharacterized protein EI90DRAFT_3151297 [Cantharellus anzutake]KAF8339861.1 hypothetical protein EI90DRAFT_3151297 [Cantharellus anzutake]